MLAGLIVLGYFAARLVLVPSSFGKFGWYRGDSLKETMALPLAYAGAAACAECHADQAEKKSKGGHKTVACESCHGPLKAHADDPTALPPHITDRRFCLRCHEASPSRPEKFPQVNPVKHYEEELCTKCHRPHQPAEAPAK